MLSVFKKLADAYRYAKKYDLNVGSFITHIILLKIFGDTPAGRWLHRFILGRVEFNELLKQTKGRVLHIGACRAEEVDLYQSYGLGAIFIEANPALEEDLKNNLAGKVGMEYIIALVMERPGRKIQFNISNHIASSSALEFSKVVTGNDPLWPDMDLKMVSTITLESTTITALIESGKLQTDGIDHLIIDTQGTELKALQGMPRELLEKASFITIEASTIPIYEGQDLFPKIKDFLAGFGYRPLWQPLSPHADLSFRRS